MPTIKDFETKHGKAKRAPHAGHATKSKTKRRPGRETTTAKGEETGMQAHDHDHNHKHGEPKHEHAHHEPKTEATAEQAAPADDGKVHLNFYGSDILKAKAPKAFELAETIADEWAKDGQFEGLPVGHPLAQLAAAYGLRKAKKVEKKLEEKGVFMMARMGLEYAKMKINKRG